MFNGNMGGFSGPSQHTYQAQPYEAPQSMQGYPHYAHNQMQQRVQGMQPYINQAQMYGYNPMQMYAAYNPYAQQSSYYPYQSQVPYAQPVASLQAAENQAYQASQNQHLNLSNGNQLDTGYSSNKQISEEDIEAALQEMSEKITSDGTLTKKFDELKAKLNEYPELTEPEKKLSREIIDKINKLLVSETTIFYRQLFREYLLGKEKNEQAVFLNALGSVVGKYKDPLTPAEQKIAEVINERLDKQEKKIDAMVDKLAESAPYSSVTKKLDRLDRKKDQTKKIEEAKKTPNTWTAIPSGSNDWHYYYHSKSDTLYSKKISNNEGGKKPVGTIDRLNKIGDEEWENIPEDRLPEDMKTHNNEA